jgi:hypothetical protein
VLELPIVIKKRKPLARVIGTITWISFFILIGTFGFTRFNNSELLDKLLALSGVTFFITLILYNILFYAQVQLHKTQGTLIFDEHEIHRVIYGKRSTIQLTELTRLEFRISGYHWEDKSSIGTLNIADGLDNFIISSTRKGSKIKTEFEMKDERELNTLKRYIKSYESQTDVKVSGLN